ncbi:MAG: FecR family protein [Pseudomonadota bacterium]
MKFCITFALSLLLGSQVFAADCGYFRVVKGDVTFKKKSKKKFRKARINKKVCQGDMVKTGPASRAKIEMADKNEINISPKTDLLIELYQDNKKAVLNVLNGKVRSNVKQKYKNNKSSHYRVKTKSAVAGVRGTEFMASYDANTNQGKIVTFEGVVAVGDMDSGGNFVGQVEVRPGQYTSNSPGTKPHPARRVPPKELAKMDRETSVSNEGPRQPAADAGNAPKEDSDRESEPKDNSGNEPKGEKQEPQSDTKEAPSGDGQDQASNNEVDGGNSREPQADAEPKRNQPANGNANNDNGGNNDPGVSSPDAGGTVAGPDGPDLDTVGGDSGGQDGGGRGVASIEPKGPNNEIPQFDGGDDLGLPPPDLDSLPSGDNLGIAQPPRIPTLNPIIDQVPECLTCNDAVINQKVNVTIVPVLPGAGGNLPGQN